MLKREGDDYGQAKASDLACLAAVVLLSIVPYVFGLGFYSDDWATLSAMANASDQSVPGLVSAQLISDPDGRARLTNTVYQALLFRAFALNPLGYHFVNALVFVSAALLLYLALLEVSLERTVALAIAAVYILLPNYSTDRFWFIAFGYGSSMALFLASTYSYLRAGRAQSVVPWTLLAPVALALAALGMEVVVPLSAAIPVLLVWQAYSRHRRGLIPDRWTLRRVLLQISPLVVIAIVSAYKAQTARGFIVPDLFYLKRLVAGAVTVNFGTFGLALPATLVWSVPRVALADAAVGAVLAATVFLYLSRSQAPPSSRRYWAAIIVAGFGAFGLGVAIFVTSARVLFWSAGIANRVWIAAATGVALVFVGWSGMIASWFPERVRRRAFAGAIALLCTCGYFVNAAFARYWVAAWPRQLEVLAHIREALPVAPSGATLILDGACPYVGPAIVFESSWDLAGALQVMYRDRRLRADVTTGMFSLDPDGLRTRIYRDSQFYPYGRDLLLFDDRRRTLTELNSRDIAQRHVSDRARCAEGIAGRGTLAFPLDLWYHDVTVTGLRWWPR
jgi:hypothetical protein